VPEEGYEEDWSGAAWQSNVRCGPEACGALACGAPGTYIARFCGFPDAFITGPGVCDGQFNAAICVDVPFEWPSTGVVEGVLNYEP